MEGWTGRRIDLDLREEEREGFLRVKRERSQPFGISLGEGA